MRDRGPTEEHHNEPATAPGGRIRVEGVRTHNLRNIDLELPRDRLVVVTGLSGSGKSSLAFDTIYAEGQRRYIESLSSYARQFLEQMPRPDCDRVSGLPPAVAIKQDAHGSGPQSTVATVTEIYDYMRLLFAKAGTPHCHKCGSAIESQTLEQMVTALASLPGGTRITLLAPVVRGRKGHYRDLFERLKREGFVKARIDGEICDLDTVEHVERYKTHDIDVVVDRVVAAPDSSQVPTRFFDSIRVALDAGNGVCVALLEDGSEKIFNRRFACPVCKTGIEEPTPQMFSFNSPYGRCPACKGRGTVDGFDEELLVPEMEKSIEQGAVEPFQNWKGPAGRRLRSNLMELARSVGADTSKPFGKLSPKIRGALLWGAGPGKNEKKHREKAVVPSLKRLMDSTDSVRTHNRIARYLSPVKCSDCNGARLRPEALSVTVGEKNIYESVRLPVSEAADFFDGLHFEGAQAAIAAPVLKELRARLDFLLKVGLHYLGCDRPVGTLSTGESQRTRLATRIGSSLTGVCYVLDEPSIGLHHRDHTRLLDALERLRDDGNSVLVIEHDADTIMCADWVLDLGPGGGTNGGQVMFNGPLENLLKDKKSLTARYLSGECEISVPKRRRKPRKGKYIRVRGATENNLKNLNVGFPLGLMICVTGVSGSGKSTLVNDILLRALAGAINNSRDKPGRHRCIEGIENIDKVLRIDQQPIGKTSRSTPVTYTKIFGHIRRVFAATKQAKVRGYNMGRFSFNNRPGRCPECDGAGEQKVEMNLLPDIKVLCKSCNGRRYNEETLQVTVNKRDISEVLDMTVDEAAVFFKNHPPIERRLRVMRDVGLNYLKLGQPANTLSGGEAQRVKLATELGKVSTGNTLYALDEPTTGLHFDDIKKLLKTLHGLADLGNTVLIIEHNLDVIKNADYVIDLGSEGGDGGGRIVAEGTPEELIECGKSYTGAALRKQFT